MKGVLEVYGVDGRCSKVRYTSTVQKIVFEGQVIYNPLSEVSR